MVNSKRNNQGATLIETLIYVAILTLIVGIVFFSVTRVLKALHSANIALSLSSTGQSIMNDIALQIRNADSVSDSSVFDSDTGSLVLTTSFDGASGIEYSLSSSVLSKNTDGNNSELHQPAITVPIFHLTRFVGTHAEGVAITLELSAVDGQTTKTATFHDFIIRRSSIQE